MNKEEILRQLSSGNHNLIILSGQKGSGKKTTARELSRILNRVYIPVGSKIDDIREINEIATKTTIDLLVCVEDGDNLTTQAQNALLKLSEEPPKNVRMLICVSNANNLLPTTKSRGLIYAMPIVTSQNIKDYIGAIYADKYSNEQIETILNIATSYGDVDEFVKLDIDEFLSFCKKVLDNIGKASKLNSLKIGNSLQLKQNTVGYNPSLFLKVVRHLIFKNSIVKRLNQATMGAIRLTNTSINYLNDSASPQMVIDNWILGLKRILKEHNQESF